jgi:PAS domain S-box-containing protein
MAWTLNESYAGLERRVEARTEELRQSEEKYRTLFEESRDAIFIRSMAGKVVDVNQATLDLFGFTREEAIGSEVSELVINDEEQVRFNRELAEAGSVKNFEQRLRKRDGTEIDCLVTAILRRNQHGDWLEVQGIIRDISDRIRAEQELKESHEAERRLAEESALLAEIGKTITSTLDIGEVYGRFASEVKKLVDFDRINVNVIDHDAGTFIFRYVSGVLQAGRRAGDIQELKGSQTERVLQTGRPLMRPDVAADVQFQVDETLLATGMVSSIMVPLKYQGRVIATLSLRSKKLGAYGDKEQAILERVADQIAPAMANAELFAQTRESEREMREAEERYQSIFDESKDPILVYSMAGRCFDVNQAALDLFGYEKQEFHPGTVRLYVQDNGEGFDPSRAKGAGEGGGFGLTGMEQRARLLDGSFHVESQEGKGTLVQVEIPTG